MKYSIITVNYNNKDGLAFTLKSISEQTNKDRECIVIDGGSTDGSLDVIRTYEDVIDYWVSEKDSGVYNAMNKGVAVAKGDWVIFMNSGDRFHSSDVLEELSLCCSADVIAGFTNRCVRHTNSTVESIEMVCVPEEMTGRHLLKYGINHQSTLIKTQLLIDNPYDETLKIVSDWKFFVEELVLRNCSYQRVPVVIADYDISGISSNPQRVDGEKQLVLRELLPARILADYQILMYGETELDKTLLEMNQNSKSYYIITLFARFIRQCQLVLSRMFRKR